VTGAAIGVTIEVIAVRTGVTGADAAIRGVTGRGGGA